MSGLAGKEDRRCGGGRRVEGTWADSGKIGSFWVGCRREGGREIGERGVGGKWGCDGRLEVQELGGLEGGRWEGRLE